jgi:hypothetical protein
MPSRGSALLSLLIVGSMLMVGCQPKPKPAPPPPPPPATMNDAGRIQADAQQRDPHARAGLVVAVHLQDQNAAVSLVPVSQQPAADDPNRVKEGSVFTFMDSSNTPIANGTVVYVEDGIYVIHYAAVEGGHAPAVGDIALHLSTP